MDEIITVSEAARELDVTRATVINYINAGALPAFRIGNQYAIERADLDAFKAARAAKLLAAAEALTGPIEK